MASSSDEIGRRRTPAGTRSQLGDLFAIAGDNESLTAHHSVEDLSPVVAQLSDGH